MLDAAPESRDENVVERAPPSTVHADDHAFPLQHAGEGRAGEREGLNCVYLDV
jgi:hypothetical protein